jgi:hypothetical protein
MAISNVTAPIPTTAQTAHRTKRRHTGSIRFSTGLLNIATPHTTGKPKAFYHFK